MAKKYHQSKKDRADESRGMKRAMEGKADSGFGDSPKKMPIPGTRSVDEYYRKQDWDGSMGYAQEKARIDREDHERLNRHGFGPRNYIS